MLRLPVFNSEQNTEGNNFGSENEIVLSLQKTKILIKEEYQRIIDSQHISQFRKTEDAEYPLPFGMCNSLQYEYNGSTFVCTMVPKGVDSISIRLEYYGENLETNGLPLAVTNDGSQIKYFHITPKSSGT